MEQNSFAQDETLGRNATGFSDIEQKAVRPIGVTILAVLHLLGAIALFGLTGVLFSQAEALEENLDTIGLTPSVMLAALIFLSLLTLASGIGMWLGRKWGWWLAAFYYVYGVFRNVSAILTVVATGDQVQSGTHGPEYYLIKYCGRAVVSFLLLSYFFKINVVAFFKVQNVNKVVAAAIMVGLCLAIAAATSMWTFFAP